MRTLGLGMVTAPLWFVPGVAQQLQDNNGALSNNDNEKPNIVIIVADDLGWGDVSHHGSVIPTPNIDRILNEGIELDRFYTAPVSSPTRCGLMTGRYPNRFGIRETVIPPWRDYGLPVEEETMADVLGRNGYAHRAAIGKWHMGHSKQRYYPLNRGFTHFHGALNGAIDYFEHTREKELDWHDDWESCYEKGYSTDLIAAESARCIKEYAKDGPYFIYTCFNAPHSPYQAPEEEIRKFISKEEFDSLPPKDQKGWTYRAMVSRMDKGIGAILQAISESGEWDNTLILFFSDNGGVPGMEPYSVNRPLRGSKFDEWEGGVRTVAGIYWKKAFRQGNRKLDQVTGFVDILPTLADIIEIKETPKNPYDGISIFSVLKGEKEQIDRDFYLGCGAGVCAQYKLILANQHMGLQKDFITDIQKNPSEKREGRIYEDPERVSQLRRTIQEGDAIVPYQEEIPFGKGQKGFVAPKEWKITEY